MRTKKKIERLAHFRHAVGEDSTCIRLSYVCRTRKRRMARNGHRIGGPLRVTLGLRSSFSLHPIRRIIMNTEQTSSSQANAGRDENGQFTAGNKGGPGNPFGRKVALLRKALIDSVTAQDIQDVATRLLALAKEGDVQAAKLLLAYAVGKPQPAREPDNVDVEEWEVYKKTGEMKKQAPGLMATATPDFYLDSVRATRPIMTFLNQQGIKEIFGETPEPAKAREGAEAVRVVDSPAPSANGKNGKRPPSPNGKEQPASKRNDRFQPSTNGDSRHDVP
jgi:hypothetical protein